MAFKQISSIAFIADSKEDLQALPFRGMGAECYVIENATEYKQNSKGEWIAQTQSVVAEGENNLPQVQTDWNQIDNTAVDYIKNKPFGLQSYEEKIQLTVEHMSGANGFVFPEMPENYLYLVVYPEGSEHICYYSQTADGGVSYREELRSFNGPVLYAYEFYGVGAGASSFGTENTVYALSNATYNTLPFSSLPIKQLTDLSTVNPTMDLIAEPTEKTGQQAYDYAVSVNNTLLQLIESYNNLIAQLNHKGYVNQM